MKSELSAHDFDSLEQKLKKESIQSSYWLKDQIAHWKSKEDQALIKVAQLKSRIDLLKQERKNRSVALQDKLFSNYTFLNAYGEKKSLLDLFRDTPNHRPPAGAGECAAPKLLHFAFTHHYKPIVMAEFWWGASPSAEVRRSGYFYPACNGKCKPILKHMLEGLEVDEDPFRHPYKGQKEIETIYEDDSLLVVNKPEELLSVPGKLVKDALISRLNGQNEGQGRLHIVHRLDMSTSGLMVLAKSKKAHEFLQKQFIKRAVKKRYVAILDGVLKEKSGEIKLPLRVDLEDRPRQLVCYEYGKMGVTEWERVSVYGKRTRIHFFPKTGRTHQLRVHSAHKDGLNMSILGDDLYGKKGNRLHLHAEELSFQHPDTRKWVTFLAPAPF
jgi:tRNA pseudouridine32 synthase/23S rRNA pseudouridine746 synthase